EPLERYGLVEDEWALLLAGRGGLNRLLGVILTLVDDDDAAVWERILGVLGSIDRHLGDASRDHGSGSVARELFTGFVRSLLQPVAARLGDEATPGEDARTPSLRASIQEALALIGGDVRQLELAPERFEMLDRDHTAVGPELAAAAVRTVAVDADAPLWSELRRRAHAAGDEQSRLRHLGALADARDPDLVLRFTDRVFSDEIRTQDGLF